MNTQELQVQAEEIEQLKAPEVEEEETEEQEEQTEEIAPETEEIPAEVLAQARKILEKKEKAGKDAMQNALKYPGVVAGSIQFEPVAGKYTVMVKCIKTGKLHRRYTSDLFQTGGLCPEAREEEKALLKKGKKELLKKAMEAIRNGQIA